jgi:hypothetical protein
MYVRAIRWAHHQSKESYEMSRRFIVSGVNSELERTRERILKCDETGGLLNVEALIIACV